MFRNSDDDGTWSLYVSNNRESKKACKLNVLSELFSCSCGRRADGGGGLRAIIWLLGGVRGDSACCQAEEGPGMAAASCGGPYKRVNSVLLAVNILRLRRSAQAVCSCSRCSPRLCLSATFSCYPFPPLSLYLRLTRVRRADLYMGHPVYKLIPAT